MPDFDRLADRPLRRFDGETTTADWRPAVDIVENKDHFVLQASAQVGLDDLGVAIVEVWHDLGLAYASPELLAIQRNLPLTSGIGSPQIDRNSIEDLGTAPNLIAGVPGAVKGDGLDDLLFADSGFTRFDYDRPLGSADAVVVDGAGYAGGRFNASDSAEIDVDLENWTIRGAETGLYAEREKEAPCELPSR